MIIMAILQVRIDENLKQQAADLYGSIGMDLSTAVRIFLKKSILEGGLPFDAKIDEDTLDVLRAIKSMRACRI